uniref:Uncharacterized protein n=1 Tax=Desulfovibrio sp. U5L TaxID=596152 RepID=I2Q1D5_9BACT
MDILTQYYNQGGQIVTKSPDLTTREFYRDVMGLHRFNEMFVPTQEVSGPTYSMVDGSIIFNFGGGSGKTVFVPVGGIQSVEGRDGRKAVIPQGTATDFSVMAMPGEEDFGIEGNCSIGLIAKSPSASTDAYPSACFSFNIESFYDRDVTNNVWGQGTGGPSFSVSLGLYLNSINPEYQSNLIEMNINGSGGDWQHAFLSKDASFLRDGAWHIFEFKSALNGTGSFFVDGTNLWSYNTGAPFNMFYRPRLSLLMFGASSVSEKFHFDTGWVKKI